MWRYLKAAFLARPEIPGLGAVPLNLVALGCVGILGLVNPGFWFLGAGLELAYLWLLVSNARFRAATDALAAPRSAAPDAAALEQALVQRLDAAARRALAAISAGCARVLELQAAAHADGFVIEANRDALARLRLTYLKLLVAEANLKSGEWDEPEASIRARIAALDGELAAAPTAAVRESKQATRLILERRLANRDERLRSLAGIAADRGRIEAQIELARENAAIQGQPQAIACDVELASGLLDYGPAAPQIADLERVQPAAPIPQ